MKEEIWKPIIGWEDMYKISSLGRVKSLSRKGGFVIMKEKLLQPVLSKIGYYVVGLTKNSKTQRIYIHRLIAEHFIPNPRNKREVNHKNGIKHDNRIENLEWMSHQENSSHAHKTGLVKSYYYKGKFGKDHNRSKPIIQLTLGGRIIAEHGSSHEAFRKTGIPRGSISLALLNSNKQAGGFKWKYKIK